MPDNYIHRPDMHPSVAMPPKMGKKQFPSTWSQNKSFNDQIVKQAMKGKITTPRVNNVISNQAKPLN